MSDNKKYYYLKFKENFFDSEAMIILESMQDGYLYSNILIKLYLRSLKNEGKLMFNNTIPYNSTILSQVVRHNVGVVEKALSIFKNLGLVDILDNGAIYMLDIQNYIGQSSSEADRQRDYQKRIKSDKLGLPDKSCKKSNRKSTPEIEIEIKKEIKQKTSSDVIFDFSGFSQDEIISINEWLDYKKERKESYKQQSGLTKLRNLLLELKSKGQLIHAIDRSITNSWKGLFEDKNFTAPEDNRTPFCINEKGQPLFFDGSTWLVVSFPVDRLLENETDFRLVKDLRK